MRRFKLALALILAFSFLPVLALAQDPVNFSVSTDWLADNLKNPNVVIVDIRKVEEYKAGHVPGAVNVFYGSWAVSKGGLQNELPSTDDLFETIGSAGITPGSTVIVVGKVDTMPDRVNATRVEWTLKYAGIGNAAVLDGGFNKWVKEKKPVTTTAARPKAQSYTGKVNPDMVATKSYVMSNLGKVILVDVREPAFYTGEKKLDFVAKPGHIKGAVNLPTLQVFNADGTFKSKQELANMAVPVVGDQTSKEIITYCDTGRFCSAWTVILMDLGYKKVRNYEGSMEEWSKEPNAPVVTGK